MGVSSVTHLLSTLRLREDLRVEVANDFRVGREDKHTGPGKLLESSFNGEGEGSKD